MPASFLVLSGEYGDVTIPVAYGSEDEVTQDLVGDPGDYAPNGDHCCTVRARALRIPVVSRPLTAVEAAAIRETIEGPVPIPCSGEYVELLGRDPGDFSVIPGPASWQHVSLASGRHVILRVDLLEVM